MDEKHEKQIAQDKTNVINLKYVWIIGAILLLIGGWFGLNTIISSFEDYRVILVDASKEAAPGSTITFTWKINGPPATINHTAVYLGTVSTLGEFGKDVGPEDTKYTDFTKDFADGKYDIPLQFVGNIKMDSVGKYYFRVYALIKDKHYWSDEYSLEVKPVDYKVSVIDAPTQVAIGDIPAGATAGKTVTFTWQIEGLPTTINSTAVHFGQVSTPGSLGKEVKPEDTQYTDFVREFADGEYDVPLRFVGNADFATPGQYFFRVHALINGQNYWTDEGTFEVK